MNRRKAPVATARTGRRSWCYVRLAWRASPRSKEPPGTQTSTIDINDDDQKSAIDCKGSAVTISGDDNRITLEGECSSPTVSGNDNTITAKTVTEITVSGDDNTICMDTVAKINTSGDDNKIRWRGGPGGKPPEVSNTGDNNKSEHDK